MTAESMQAGVQSGVLDPTLHGLGRCGCCAGLGPSTPALVFNRPGLSAIAYRSGTWHEFKASMLAALAPGVHPELAGLATRSDDDFTIALLDATATVADVLTFYGERIANEAYLRTATERRSILELARLIGYELRPGVAAQTLVAFTVDDAPGAPGVATLDVGLKIQSVPGHDEKPQTFETVEKLEARVAWNAMRPALAQPQSLGSAVTEIWLAGTATNLRGGDYLLLVGPERAADLHDEHWDLRRVTAVVPEFDRGRTHVTVAPGLGSSNGSSPPSAAPEVYAMRLRAGAFGQNAADWNVMSTEFKTSYLGHAPGSTDTNWPGFDDIWSPASTGVDWSTTAASLDLDGAYQAIVPGGWLALVVPEYAELYGVTGVSTVGRAQFGVSGKSTRAALAGENFPTFSARRRDVLVLAANEHLPQAESPIDPPVTGAVSRIVLAADPGDLPAGRSLVFAGTDASTGEPATESAVLDHVDRSGAAPALVLAAALERSYRLADLVVYGNVALATHGESVAEVLGAGSAATPFQKFALRQPPLTYVRDPAAAAGTASTLEVRVNDLRWTEVRSFYGAGPKDRVYTTRRADDGTTTVAFGDGVNGARLPTGRENVRARYRKGVGAAANVRAGQLSTLLTRPLGLKAGVNPTLATGGGDPEALSDARGNAPLTVMTLDRVVSLEDYEDFARAYAGIGKALATWSWDGERRGVFVTVAGPVGAAVSPDVVKLLAGAIRAAGDPYVSLRVETYATATFTTSFKALIDPAYEQAAVFAAMVAALRDAFGFDARAFGQPVALSDVVATLQAVAGVTAVDVDSLRRTDGVGGDGLLAPLPAALPQAESLAGTLPAELLTLAADPIEPGEMA